MIKIIHPLAAPVARRTIASFWFSTAITELFASEATVTAAKAVIPWGFLLLIPATDGGGSFGLCLGERTAAGRARHGMPPIGVAEAATPIR